jgi:hypothetical protein
MLLLLCVFLFLHIDNVETCKLNGATAGLFSRSAIVYWLWRFPQRRVLILSCSHIQLKAADRRRSINCNVHSA